MYFPLARIRIREKILLKQTKKKICKKRILIHIDFFLVSIAILVDLQNAELHRKLSEKKILYHCYFLSNFKRCIFLVVVRDGRLTSKEQTLNARLKLKYEPQIYRCMLNIVHIIFPCNEVNNWLLLDASVQPSTAVHLGNLLHKKCDNKQRNSYLKPVSAI